MQGIRIVDWREIGDRVELVFSDYTKLFVRHSDFNRAFGCIINADKDVIEREFAV